MGGALFYFCDFQDLWWILQRIHGLLKIFHSFFPLHSNIGFYLHSRAESRSKADILASNNNNCFSYSKFCENTCRIFFNFITYLPMLTHPRPWWDHLDCYVFWGWTVEIPLRPKNYFEISKFQMSASIQDPEMDFESGHDPVWRSLAKNCHRFLLRIFVWGSTWGLTWPDQMTLILLQWQNRKIQQLRYFRRKSWQPNYRK